MAYENKKVQNTSISDIDGIWEVKNKLKTLVNIYIYQ